MLDPLDRSHWFHLFLEEAEATARPRNERERMQVIRWARSMSLIAEQFVDPPYEGEFA